MITCILEDFKIQLIIVLKMIKFNQIDFSVLYKSHRQEQED